MTPDSLASRDIRCPECGGVAMRLTVAISEEREKDTYTLVVEPLDVQTPCGCLEPVCG